MRAKRCPPPQPRHHLQQILVTANQRQLQQRLLVLLHLPRVLSGNHQVTQALRPIAEKLVTHQHQEQKHQGPAVNKVRAQAKEVVLEHSWHQVKLAFAWYAGPVGGKA